MLRCWAGRPEMWSQVLEKSERGLHSRSHGISVRFLGADDGIYPVLRRHSLTY